MTSTCYCVTLFYCRYFLEQGYAVIFLTRNRGLRPFLRHVPTSNLLDLLTVSDKQVTGKNECLLHAVDVMTLYFVKVLLLYPQQM